MKNKDLKKLGNKRRERVPGTAKKQKTKNPKNRKKESFQKTSSQNYNRKIEECYRLYICCKPGVISAHTNKPELALN